MTDQPDIDAAAERYSLWLQGQSQYTSEHQADVDAHCLAQAHVDTRVRESAEAEERANGDGQPRRTKDERGLHRSRLGVQERKDVVMAKINPLRRRTMTVDELRREVLKVLRATRKQFNREAWQEGLSDSDFKEQVLDQLEIRIIQDIEVEKMHRERELAFPHVQFFVDTGDGVEYHDTAEAAKKSAEAWIAEYHQQPEWDEAVERVCWGVVREYAMPRWHGENKEYVTYELKEPK